LRRRGAAHISQGQARDLSTAIAPIHKTLNPGPRFTGEASREWNCGSVELFFFFVLLLKKKGNERRAAMAKMLLPSLNRVLVEKLVQPKKTAGGILVPETSKQVAAPSPAKR
jgi:hypothetical protein